MGRVARYKKIKACDPFARNGMGMMSFMWGEGDNGQRQKKRSKTSEKLRHSKQQRKKLRRQDDDDDDDNFDDYFNLPPSDQKDEFIMEDMVHSIQKQAPPVNVLDTLDPSEQKSEAFSFPDLSHTHVASGPKEALSLDQELRASRFLKLDVSQPSSNVLKKSDSQVEGRKEGESKRAFSKRMKLEIQRAIRKEKVLQTDNTESKKRKKEYLKERKEKKRRKQLPQAPELDSIESPRREIPWNEQAERPPTFSVLPRGAVSKTKGSHSLSSDSSLLTASKQHAEQRAMERMREMVQERYAILKAQRKHQK
jgi:hypothetical protein